MRRRQLLLLRSEDMFEVGGFYFPDGERHFTRFGDFVREYGQLDRDAAYPYVKRWRRALDVGANVGIFSCDFAKRFQEVVAFEPVPRTRECLVRNVPGKCAGRTVCDRRQRVRPEDVPYDPEFRRVIYLQSSGGDHADC